MKQFIALQRKSNVALREDFDCRNAARPFRFSRVWWKTRKD